MIFSEKRLVSSSVFSKYIKNVNSDFRLEFLSAPHNLQVSQMKTRDSCSIGLATRGRKISNYKNSFVFELLICAFKIVNNYFITMKAYCKLLHIENSQNLHNTPVGSKDVA